MTEDAVRKFLQQVLLWLEKDQSVKTMQSDQISGAVTDIEGLITTMLKETSVAAFLIDNSIINQITALSIKNPTKRSPVRLQNPLALLQRSLILFLQNLVRKHALENPVRENQQCQWMPHLFQQRR